MADELKCGTIFEKAVQLMLRKQGYDAERNVCYRKRLFKPDWHQIDIDYHRWSIEPFQLRLKKHVIGECKYTRVGRIYLYDSIDQLLGNMVFVKSDEGVLFTNEKMNGKREGLEKEFGIKVYDWSAIQELYVSAGGKKDTTWEIMMKDIRYNPKKDHKRIERYARWA